MNYVLKLEREGISRKRTYACRRGMQKANEVKNRMRLSVTAGFPHLIKLIKFRKLYDNFLKLLKCSCIFQRSLGFRISLKNMNKFRTTRNANFEIKLCVINF